MKSSPSILPPPWNPTGFSRIRLSPSVSSTRLLFAISVNVFIVTLWPRLTSDSVSNKKLSPLSACNFPSDDWSDVPVINNRLPISAVPISNWMPSPAIDLTPVVARNTKPLEVLCVLLTVALSLVTMLDRRKTSAARSPLTCTKFALSVSSTRLYFTLVSSPVKNDTPSVPVTSRIRTPLSSSKVIPLPASFCDAGRCASSVPSITILFDTASALSDMIRSSSAVINEPNSPAPVPYVISIPSKSG